MAFPKYLEDNYEIVTNNFYNTIRTNIFADCSYNKKTTETSTEKKTKHLSSVSCHTK